jgi:uncharacterized membrane protein YedE/YeeE
MEFSTSFTPLMSLLGGILIGVSVTLLMALHGRIAGMTGILTGLLPPLASDWAWRGAYIAGAVLAPALYVFAGGRVDFAVPSSTLALIGGGLLVGIGVFFGSGCTSGHGVCGMARLSPRSIVATLTFMATAFATVYVMRHVMVG